jgi:hypothetical protein
MPVEELVIMAEELVAIEVEFVLAMLSVLLIEELGVVISEELLVDKGVEVELCAEEVGGAL